MSIVAKPYTFSPNTTASSSQVNSNFDTLYNDYNGGISAANLATDAVTTAKIADSNVTTAKLADGSVTADKMADDSIFPANLTAGLSGSTWEWQDWTPTLGNLSGGTLNYAKYIQIGKTVHYRLAYTLAGAGVAGSVTFSLPVTSIAYVGSAIIGRIRFQDTGTGNTYGVVQYSSTTTGLMVVETANATYLTGSVLSSTVPHTWASTDIISVTGTYEAD